jgi:diamine N-acetyltransferase
VSDITVRRAVAGDAGLLSMIGGATFFIAFAHDHPGDGLVDHVESEHSRAYYDAALADPACAIWIAETRFGAPVAYAMLTPPKLDCPTKADDLELKRIYVLPEWQKHGLGAILLDAVEAEAARRGAARLFLCVYTQNDRAQRFYDRRGFADTGCGQRFMVGSKPFADMIWAKPLG